jgi:hypothetical protein
LSFDEARRSYHHFSGGRSVSYAEEKDEIETGSNQAMNGRFSTYFR